MKEAGHSEYINGDVARRREFHIGVPQGRPRCHPARLRLQLWNLYNLLVFQSYNTLYYL